MKKMRDIILKFCGPNNRILSDICRYNDRNNDHRVDSINLALVYLQNGQ